MTDTTIVLLPSGSAISAADPFESVQSGGTVSVKVTATQIGTFVRALFTATPATVAEGGTGAATAAGARTNLGAIGDPSTGQNLRANGSWIHTFVSPGYVSANWYPSDYGISTQAGATLTLNTMYFAPFVIYADVTITDLAAEVSTAVAASNFQLAIYAADATTKRPSGAALVSTSSMSSATATQVSQTLGSPLVLVAGLYWIGVNTDTSGVAFRSGSATQGWVSSYTGGSTAARVVNSSTGNLGFNAAQTYGTWPTLPALTESIGGARQMLAAYKAQ